MLGIDKLLPKKKVSDMLPWIAACGDNRTIYTKAGGFLQVAKVEARPLDAASWPAIDTYYDQLAALEGRADDGWTFFHDCWKWHRDANLPMCSFGGNRAAQLIDWSERRQFAEDKAFDRTLFMALHYEPEHARAGLAQWLVGRDTAFSESAELVRFREQIDKFWAELWHIVPQVTLLEGSYDPRLKGDALGSYLSMVANYEATPATLPIGRIDRCLGTSRWVAGTDPFVPHQYIPPTHLKIGRRHIRTVEVYSIGAITADTLRELDQLEYENRVVVRVDATARHRQTKWLAQLREECAQNRQSPFRRVLGWFTRKDEGDSNPAAAYQAAEAEQLRADVMLGDAGFAPITMTIRVWHEDPTVADRRALDVEVKLKNLGFRAEQSDLSAVLSVLADVPGRDPEPREIPSPYIQLIRLAPIAGASIGSKADGKWDGPALLLGYGEKGPVRFAWHGPGEDNGNTAIVGQSGCHAKGTPVLMHDGRVRLVEDVRVGDRLMGPDSTPRTVLALHRGRDRMFEVRPTKGEAHVVNGGHTLSLKVSSNNYRKSLWTGRIVDISIPGCLGENYGFRAAAKLWRVGVEFPPQTDPLRIEPYFLGLWLGDGTQGSASVTTADPEVQEYLAGYAVRLGLAVRREYKPGASAVCIHLIAPDGAKGTRANALSNALSAYGLRGAKHIPHRYKAASSEVRLELLAGLIDSDGHYDRGYDVIFKSERLARDLIFLARSVGLAAYCAECQKTCTNNGVSGTYYRVSISGHIDKIPCRIPRKQAQPRQQIKDVLCTSFILTEFYEDDYFGFEVDGDHRYLLGDFTVTHNSGKSALLAKLVAATLKYEGARVVVFDLGRAFMPTCLCLGGDWRELGRGTACVQPLRHIDVPEQAILIHDWLSRAIQHQGVRRTHETDHAIHSAMRLVARLPMEKRTMSGLVARLGASADVREALRSFTGEGQWGEIFDGVVESHGSGCVMGREVGGIRDAAILPLLVSAVFDALRYEMLSTGAPSLVVFDEFHALVQRAAFRGEVDRLAREIRKLNGVMVLATQSPAELTEDLAAVVVDQCPNLIFAANPDVLDENTARWYRQLGCTDEELDLIATGYQKRDYFFRTRQYRARLAIRLAEDAVAICGHTSPLDIQMCRQLVADGVAPGEDFLERWQAYVAAKQERRDRAA